MRFTLPDRMAVFHELAISVRWGDMDAAGHVNNTNFFRYLEMLRLDWLAQLGFTVDPAGTGPALVNAFCTFHKQLVHPAIVTATLYASVPGRTTLDTYATLKVGGELRGSGGAKLV